MLLHGLTAAELEFGRNDGLRVEKNIKHVQRAQTQTKPSSMWQTRQHRQGNMMKTPSFCQ
jgi:phage gp29-like protein